MNNVGAKAQKIAQELFLQGIIQAEQQEKVIEIIEKIANKPQS